MVVEKCGVDCVVVVVDECDLCDVDFVIVDYEMVSEKCIELGFCLK